MLPAADAQGNATADNCSIAIAGNVTNSTIKVTCIIAPSEAARRIADTLAVGHVDPSVARAVRSGAFEDALARIDRLVAEGVSDEAALLSLATQIETMKGNIGGATGYAHRAYELRPNDVQATVDYYTLLNISGRTGEANQLLDSADRRRGQFGDRGAAIVETIRFFRDTAPVTLMWHMAALECAEGAGAGRAGSSTGRTGHPARTAASRDCPADPLARSQAREFRVSAARLSRGLSRLGPNDRLAAPLNYRLLNFLRVCDHLVGDSRAAVTSTANVGAFERRLFEAQGPWAVLRSIAATFDLEFDLSDDQRRERYRLFDQALNDATVVPIAAAGEPNAHMFTGLGPLMLSNYEVVAAISAALRDDFDEAWRRVVRAVQRARQAPATVQSVSSRLQLAQALIMIASDYDGDTDLDTTTIGEEVKQLRDIMMATPRPYAALSATLADAIGEGCDEDLLPAELCGAR